MYVVRLVHGFKRVQCQVVEEAYRAYAPLFNALHGARWLLSAAPAYTRPTGPAVNVFTLGNTTLLVPVMLAGEGTTSVELGLCLGFLS